MNGIDEWWILYREFAAITGRDTKNRIFEEELIGEWVKDMAHRFEWNPTAVMNNDNCKCDQVIALWWGYTTQLDV